MMNRSYFTFYRSYFESIRDLRTPKERYHAYKIICDYGLNRTEPDLSVVKPTAAMLFALIRPMLDKDYVRAVKRAKLKAIGNGQADISLAELKLDTRPDEDILAQIKALQ